MSDLEKFQIILVLTDEIVRDTERMTFPEYVRFQFDAMDETATYGKFVHDKIAWDIITEADRVRRRAELKR